MELTFWIISLGYALLLRFIDIHIDGMKEEYIDVIRGFLAIKITRVISMYSSLITLYTVNARSSNIWGKIFFFLFVCRSLSYNKLSGSIPDSLAKLPKLTYLWGAKCFPYLLSIFLYFYCLDLQVSVITEFFCHVLDWRDVRYNQLSGEIPQSLLQKAANGQLTFRCHRWLPFFATQNKIRTLMKSIHLKSFCTNTW